MDKIIVSGYVDSVARGKLSVGKSGEGFSLRLFIFSVDDEHEHVFIVNEESMRRVYEYLNEYFGGVDVGSDAE